MQSVATQNAQKLNQLLRSIPQGMVVDAAWLTDAGYSTSLRSQYVAAGWLERPARGVYQAPASVLTWEAVVASLQHLMHRSLHVGGRSALELHGYGPEPRARRAVVGRPLHGRAAALLAPPAPRHADVRSPLHRSTLPDGRFGHGGCVSDRTVIAPRPERALPAARVGPRASVDRAPRRRPPPRHLRAWPTPSAMA